MMKILSATTMTVVLAAQVQAATLPTLPLAQVDVSMPPVTGSTLNATCSTLQAQINAAAALDVNLTHQIILATGATCTGPYKLPSHNGGTGWILIKGPNFASLPPSGTRVGPGDTALMPVIKYGENGGFDTGMFAAQTGAQRYRIIGISMIQDSSFVPNWSFVSTGYNSINSLNTGYIILDRVVMQDTDINHATHQGVYMNADQGHTALIDSYIAGIKDVGRQSDTQAVLITANPGPILIRNNFLQASGENVMTGGGGTPSSAQIPQDITIQLNLFSKDPNWVSLGQTLMKTLFELKCSLRVLVEGNDFTNMPLDDGGMSFRLTPRGNSGSTPGGEPWCEVSDITYRYNHIYNVFNWINSIGSDDGGPGFESMHSKRWYIHDNLVHSFVTNCQGYSPCGEAFAMQAGGQGTNCTDPTPTCQVENFTFAHNTIDNVGSWVLSQYNPLSFYLDFRDNLINSNNSYGILNINNPQSTNLNGTNMLNYIWGSNWSMTHNAMAAVGGNSLDPSYYPQGNGNIYPASYTAFLWNNPAAGDYTLQAGSPAKNAASDGTDLGVNFAAYNAARAGGSAPPPDTLSPAKPLGLVLK